MASTPSQVITEFTSQIF